MAPFTLEPVKLSKQFLRHTCIKEIEMTMKTKDIMSVVTESSSAVSCPSLDKAKIEFRLVKADEGSGSQATSSTCPNSFSVANLADSDSVTCNFTKKLHYAPRMTDEIQFKSKLFKLQIDLSWRKS